MKYRQKSNQMSHSVGSDENEVCFWEKWGKKGKQFRSIYRTKLCGNWETQLNIFLPIGKIFSEKVSKL